MAPSDGAPKSSSFAPSIAAQAAEFLSNAAISSAFDFAIYGACPGISSSFSLCMVSTTQLGKSAT